MERATEKEWLLWFYQNADQFITEENRQELERRFIQEEKLRLPQEYEVD